MNIAKSTLVFLIFVLILSILVANVANLIDVDSRSFDNTVQRKDTQEKEWHRPRKYNIGDSSDNLIWFLQISDLHISVFRDPTRLSELKIFCNETVNVFKPPVVLASGDLTDAKTSDRMGSRQVLKEWQEYKQVLDEAKMTEKTIWLDVRGNHDNFNVLTINSKENYFLKYSVQGKHHPRSYIREITVGSGKYSFIAVDACLEPGPKRPFNFVGSLNKQEIENIHKLANQSQVNNADFIIWFGHYPTSCVIAECNGGVRNLLGQYEEGLVYLCGHYHTLGGMVPNMYSLHHAGFLELELADWKDNRMYRLAAIDHGQFSFVDIKHREWPVILITNPKNAQFAMPWKENLQSIIDSSYIRVLAFSISPIKSVEVKIDEGDWLECKLVDGPLYVVPWNNSDYRKGIHHIEAKVVDNDGNVKTQRQPFSLDGSRIAFGILPRILLMWNASHLFQIMFAIVIVILVLPLCILRFMHTLYTTKRKPRPRLTVVFFHWWLKKLWILSTVDRLFFPLVIYAVYLTFGPWSIGEIIDDHTGVIFAWGTFVGGSFLPGSFTYAYGFFQLFSFHLPLILILAHRIERRLNSIEQTSTSPVTKLRLLWQHLPFFCLLGLQLSMIYFFWLAYGTIAMILCPLRTWSVILALILWQQVYKMPYTCLRSAGSLWCLTGPLARKDVNED